MLQPGQQLAHFSVIRKLGQGGMGAVFLAEDRKLNRRVALKVLSGDLFDDAERLERFHREARTAAQISNAYVMATYDTGEAAAEPGGPMVNYIVLEYIEGRPLLEFIKEERLELSGIVRIAEKIASGMAAAHKLNIVHRDIKPENVLIDENGDPKILDFGLAKPLEPALRPPGAEATQTVSAELTRVGKIVGTVSYMSPEQLRGDRVDSRSDIFSFGILLYRLVAGELPFAGPSQVDTMARILESSYVPPREKNAQVPSELERVIAKCLQKDPEDRYQSTRDLVVDLRNVRRQYDSGLTESITGPTSRVSRLGRRRSLQVGVALAVVAVVALALLYPRLERLTFGTGGTRPGGLQAHTDALAILGFENKTGDPELDWLQTGLPEILLTDLVQSRDVSLVSHQRVLDCLDADRKNSPTRQDLVGAARSIGATRLLAGSFYRLGDKIRIDARVEDAASGDVLLAEKVVGADPFVLVDSLSAKVAALLNIEHAAGSEAFAVDPEAFKQYHLGMEKFWAGMYDEAIALFEKALAIDSTYALPYMRIGMAHIFQEHRAEGVAYFQKAKAYEGRLPVRERSMLDAYLDVWVYNNFDEAMVKLTTIQHNYPDDAEIRTLYAIFLDIFRRDTTAAFAQLDTVLTTYPTYLFALEQTAQLHSKYGDYERAIEYNERLRQVAPGALDPQIQLVSLYSRQGRRAEAMILAAQLADRFPTSPHPLDHLIRLCIWNRDFAAAHDYAERLKAQKPSDPYSLIDYHQTMANLAVWEGRFADYHRNLSQAFARAVAITDSSQAAVAAQQLSFYYRIRKHPDSINVWAREVLRWSVHIARIAYAMIVVESDPGRAAEVRPVVKEATEMFKARTPKEIWVVADNLDSLFEAFARFDTAQAILALEAICDNPSIENEANARELAILLISSGRYEDGIKRLEPIMAGEKETISGWQYLLSQHYLGWACEGLGRKSEAIGHYQEVLRFWGSSDVQLSEIAETRARLARLTS